MNGPEHYAEAEHLMTAAGRQYGDSEPGDPSPLWRLTIAEAQVHATLALAAATATLVPVEGESAPEVTYSDPGWEGVLGFEALRRDGGYVR